MTKRSVFDLVIMVIFLFVTDSMFEIHSKYFMQIFIDEKFYHCLYLRRILVKAFLLQISNAISKIQLLLKN